MTNADVLAWAGRLRTKYGIPFPFSYEPDDEDYEDDDFETEEEHH